MLTCPFCGAQPPDFGWLEAEYDPTGPGSPLRLTAPIRITACCGRILSDPNLNGEVYARIEVVQRLRALLAAEAQPDVLAALRHLKV